MNNYCAFSNNHRCIKWTDYEITRAELEEADSLCHENWSELKRYQQYIKTLQNILEENGITYPEI